MEHGFRNILSLQGNAEAAQFMQIYRSREVGQSYITSVGTSLIAIAHAIWFILKIRPQVVWLSSFILWLILQSLCPNETANARCVSSDHLQWSRYLYSTLCCSIHVQGQYYSCLFMKSQSKICLALSIVMLINSWMWMFTNLLNWMCCRQQAFVGHQSSILRVLQEWESYH